VFVENAHRLATLNHHGRDVGRSVRPDSCDGPALKAEVAPRPLRSPAPGVDVDSAWNGGAALMAASSAMPKVKPGDRRAPFSLAAPNVIERKEEPI
jgi:hypothetical protein